MRKQPRFLGAVALAGITLGTLTACDALSSDKGFEDDATVSQKITSVRLDGNGGAVTLRGMDGPTRVSLNRTVNYKGDRPEGPTHRVENGVLVLGGCGNHCWVSYSLNVPAGIPVTGSTSNGAITLSKVGAVKVRTTNGAIDLDGVSGAVEVRTTNGWVKGRGLTGTGIKAETTNGEISLSPAKAQDIRAKTTNGTIDVTVPAGRYQVSADTSNANKNIGIADDPSGDHRIDLSTSNGAITVKPS